MSCGPTHQFDHDCQYPAPSTLKYAVADSALAIMAKALGHDADASTLNARGQNYRNLFDPSIGFFRPRDSGGAWVSPYNPTDGGHKFHEAGAYQYQWMVPQHRPHQVGQRGVRLLPPPPRPPTPPPGSTSSGCTAGEHLAERTCARPLRTVAGPHRLSSPVRTRDPVTRIRVTGVTSPGPPVSLPPRRHAPVCPP
ncbi:glycoside hydrolase domain-containing protein [Longispora sp. NPDC051575]|uniref:glycoside hydrolase domain-containing protein n=1 Tax=Longispora sp. NPDC051575 TaxID=3154943 RepID=UPI0034473048